MPPVASMPYVGHVLRYVALAQQMRLGNKMRRECSEERLVRCDEHLLAQIWRQAGDEGGVVHLLRAIRRSIVRLGALGGSSGGLFTLMLSDHVCLNLGGQRGQELGINCG